LSRGTALAAAVVVAVVAGTVALLAFAATPRGTACGEIGGGEAGVEAQLRYVDVGAGQVTFTFGPSAVSDRFGVPRFRLARQSATPPPELDTGTHRLGVEFDGASGFNPDLTSSYLGKSVIVPANDGAVREVQITRDTGRVLSWDLVVSREECPTVTTNVYVWGKSPRAQVTFTFGQTAWITAEHPATYVGSPILAPVLVTGMGFVPRSEVTFRIAGAIVDSGTTDDTGRVETGIFVPKLRPGVYELAVSDASGRRATTQLVVTDER